MKRQSLMIPENIKIRLEDEFHDKIQATLRKYNLVKNIKDKIDTPKEFYDYNLNKYLKIGVELTAKTHPSLFKIISDVTKKLSINPAFRVFKSKQGRGENAFIISHGNKAILVFDEDILNLIGNNPDELKFIIGHEFGHFIFKHTEDVDLQYVFMFDSPFYKLTKAEERFYKKEGEFISDMACLASQVTEFNADRIGLIASNNFEASALAAVKMSGGNLDHFGKYSVETYLEQANELLKTRNYFSIEDVRTTHPHFPFRVYALNQFYKSNRFDSFTEPPKPSISRKHSIGKTSGESTMSDDKLLSKIMPLSVFTSEHKESIKAGSPSVAKNRKVTKPKPEKPDGDISIENQIEFKKDLFLFIAAIWVVTSVDDKISNAENNFLNRCVRNKENLRIILEFNNNADDDAVEEKYMELVPAIKKLPSRSKTAIIKNLIYASKCDRRVDDEEINMILLVAEEIDAIPQAKVQLKRMLGIQESDLVESI